MADEIAVQFDRRPIAEAATEIAGHIRTFWKPRMRRALLAAIDSGADTAPVVHAAAAAAAAARVERCQDERCQDERCQDELSLAGA